MKYLLLFLIATSAFGTMSAKEARLKATKERIGREKACTQGFLEHIDTLIDEAVSKEENFVSTDCYTCPHGIYAIAKKLEKLGYRVHVLQCNDASRKKYLRINW